MLQSQYLQQTFSSLMVSCTGEKQDDNEVTCIPVFPSLESLTVPRPSWLQLSPLFPNIKSLEIVDMDGWIYGSRMLLNYKYLAKVHPRLRKLHTPEQGISLVVEGKIPFIGTRNSLRSVL
jgi:hypothetical protein